MDSLGSEWDCQTAEISAYHYHFLSACTQTDTLKHLFIDLMHDLCNRIVVLKESEEASLLYKSLSAGAPHSGTHSHCICSL